MAELQLIPSDRPNYTKTVLRVAVGGVIVAGATFAPNLISLLAKLIPDSSGERTIRAIRYAKQQGWLTFKETKKGVKVALTESGKIKWQKIILSEPLFQKRWDSKWRLVIFDIPTNKKQNAEAFRKSLKKLGLKQLQKSIWVTPYKCQTQVAYLRQEYEIKKYVRIAEVLAIDGEAELKSLFNL